MKFDPNNLWYFKKLNEKFKQITRKEVIFSRKIIEIFAQNDILLLKDQKNVSFFVLLILFKANLQFIIELSDDKVIN